MKKIILMILFLLTICIDYAQQNETANYLNIIRKQTKDTTEVNAMISLAWLYLFTVPDSAIIVAKGARDLARKLKYSEGEGGALNALGEASHIIGDFPQALEALFNALRIGRAINDKDIESNSLDFIGIAYVDLGEYRLGLNYLYQAEKMNDKTSVTTIVGMKAFRFSNIGHAYEKLGKKDSALFFQRQAQIMSDDSQQGPETALILTRLGAVQADLGNYTQALNHYKEAIQIGDVLNVGSAQYQLAELFHTLNQPDSSLHYARLAFMNNQKAVEKTWVLKTSGLLAKLYKAKSSLDSAFHYQGIAMAMNDSLFGPEKFNKLELLAISEQQQQQEILEHQKEIQHEKERFETKIKMIALLTTIGIFLLLAIILYRNNQRKQKTNLLLSEQKQKVEITLSELKSTQAQLIQSEKMASLGELTAGIAHEIQNPLNFVNNFSEVNNELIEELKIKNARLHDVVGQEKLKIEDNEVDELLNDIYQNNEKISMHGKRADAIVKGMLQHSRTSSGQKEQTDINALCGEYLRLAYHGLKAKDKSFNAVPVAIGIKTDFDPTVGKINVVPQDIGRVLLNLINNAFYSVNEKAKLRAASYEPLVSVSTKRKEDKVEITITDNGNGIAQKIVDKIFQPFFTTKPTGQGTGLGLSLAYDIIKAHGGEIKVQTKEGDGSEFIIQLPLK